MLGCLCPTALKIANGQVILLVITVETPEWHGGLPGWGRSLSSCLHDEPDEQQKDPGITLCSVTKSTENPYKSKNVLIEEKNKVIHSLDDGTLRCVQLLHTCGACVKIN